jgi:proteic killer suppression protein
VIRSFKNPDTQRIYHRRFSTRFPANIQPVALRKLRMLNNAAQLGDLLAPPGNRLERLKGSRFGQYSIRIDDQWRICFEWRGNDAYQVEIVDYH